MKYGLLALLILLVAGYIAIRTGPVQTWVAQRLADNLSERLGTKVSIEKVDLEFIKTLELEGLYIEDLEGDTLIHAPRVLSDISFFDLQGRFVSLYSLILTDPTFELKMYEGRDHLNLKFLVDFIRPDNDEIRPWKILVGDLKITGGRFSFKNFNRPDTSGGIQFRDLETSKVNAHLRKISYDDDSVSVEVDHLSLKERSGFQLDTLITTAAVGPNGMEFQGVNITTPESNVQLDLSFISKDYRSYQDFVEEVEMKGNIEPSSVNFSDIAYFAPKLIGLNRKVEVNGDVKGEVSDLKGDDMFIQLDENSYFKGDFSLTGLPDIKETFISMNAEKITINDRELETIPLPPFDKNKTLTLPENIKRLGQMTFKGDFTGFINDFVAYGEMNTELGRVRTDISLKKDTSDQYYYSGKLATYEFDLGRFYELKDVGRISSYVEMRGTGLALDRMQARVDGKIRKFDYRGYDYQKVDIKGALSKNRFNGEIMSKDENFEFDFNGMVDLQKDPHEYKFEMNVQKANLTTLNLINRDSSAQLSTRLEMNAKGNTVDELTGELMARDTKYSENGKSLHYHEMYLRVSKMDEEKQLDLRTPFVQLKAKGRFRSKELAPSLMSQVYNALPSLRPKESPIFSRDQQFELNIQFNETDSLTDIFLPGFSIAENSVINGAYDTRSSHFDLVCFAPELTYQDKVFRGVQAEVNKKGDILQLIGQAKELQLNDTTQVNDIILDAKAFQDNVQLSLDWVGGSPHTNGRIEGVAYIKGRDKVEFDFLPSEFLVNETRWAINPKGKIKVDASAIRVSNLDISADGQLVHVDGKLSQSAFDEMNFLFQDIQLAYLNPFMNLKGTNLHGSINGEATLSDIYHELKFIADVQVDSFRLDDQMVGDLNLTSQWDDKKKRMDLGGALTKENEVTLDIKGNYDPKEKTDPFDVALILDELDVAFLNAFLDQAVSDIHGKASGKLKLRGSLKHPDLIGEVEVHEAGLKVDYLNTHYTLNDQVIAFNKEMITFDYIPFYDKLENRGYATGTMIHQDFQNWNFNIFFEFTQCERLLCMNTTRQMNDLYYGKAFATGTAEIAGYEDQLEINVTAKSEKGSEFYLPLSGSEEVSMENFVTFVQEDTVSEETEYNLEGIDMNFDLEVTPDALVQIIFDEEIGDIMKGSGQGNINMEVNSAGTFEMFGQYEIREGEYLFTMRDVINKRFSIKDGGTINWYGDPYNAQLDLDAVYSLRTSLYDLMYGNVEDPENYKKRVPVELVLHLSNNLMNPDIRFDIQLPTVSEEVRTIAQSQISTTEQLNKQAFSLLVLRKFIPSPGGDRGLGVTSATSSELLSNQLSNWLSSISREFDIGVNYRPGDEITDEELAVALSTQLFNERLSIATNVGVTTSNTEISGDDQNSLVGDFQVEYDITSDGKFKLKVFNESNDQNLSSLEESDYTQGVGVFYQEEFDTAGELIRELGNLFRRKDQNKQQKEEDEDENGKEEDGQEEQKPAGHPDRHD